MNNSIIPLIANLFKQVERYKDHIKEFYCHPIIYTQLLKESRDMISKNPGEHDSIWGARIFVNRKVIMKAIGTYNTKEYTGGEDKSFIGKFIVLHKYKKIGKITSCKSLNFMNKYDYNNFNKWRFITLTYDYMFPEVMTNGGWCTIDRLEYNDKWEIKNIYPDYNIALVNL